jgi:CarD family transcriptional regulator
VSELVYACDKTPEQVEKWLNGVLANNQFKH